MNYNNSLARLDEVINAIKANDAKSLELFSVFLESAKEIPPFSSKSVWDLSWRKKVWEFGTLFSKDHKSDASSYIYKLNEMKWEENEALAFIYSEVVWNFFGQSDAFKKDTFKNLIKKYLGNPEFYHTYAHYLAEVKEYEQAIINYKSAVDLDRNNTDYIQSLFSAWSTYFSILISKAKLDEAEKLRKEMLNFFNQEHLNSKFWPLKNIVVGMSDRINDHKIIREKIDGINEIITKRIEGVRSHLINVVSLITAIIGYLLIGTNIVLSSKTIKESFLLMFGLGAVMIIFVTSISYILKSNSRENFFAFFTHRRFWAIIILLSILIVTYCLL